MDDDSQLFFYRYFDTHIGWDNDKPGWHLVAIDLKTKTSKQPDPGSPRAVHFMIVQWLYENIDSCEKHCRWTICYDKTLVKFRYEKDALWFSMKW